MDSAENDDRISRVDLKDGGADETDVMSSSPEARAWYTATKLSYSA